MTAQHGAVGGVLGNDLLYAASPSGARTGFSQAAGKFGVCERFVSGHDFSRADKSFIYVIRSRLGRPEL